MKKILLGFIIVSCIGCQSKIEDKFCECIYKSHNLNENEFNNIFKKIENHLIEQKVLKDNSSNSYFDLLSNISNGYDIYFIPSKEFTKLFNNINEESIISLNDCYNKLKSKKDFKNSNIKILGDSLINSSDKSAQKVLNLYLKIIPKEDLINNYHKYKIFFILFYFNKYNNGISNLIPEFKGKDNKEKIAYNALDIKLNENNEIIINENKISKNNFRKIVYDFEKENESITQFNIYTKGETSYAFYLEIESHINIEVEKLKNEIAINKYQNNYSKLSEEIQKEINSIYPIKIKNLEY